MHKSIFNLNLPKRHDTGASILRNKERKNGSAKQGFKHAVLKATGTKANAKHSRIQF
jgi:hypothetical protein